MKYLPLINLPLDNYGMYNLPPTKKEGGRMAVIVRDVIFNNRVLQKKGTKGAVIPFSNFGLCMLFQSYNSWLRENKVTSNSNFLIEGPANLSRTYDFFHTYNKNGKEIVGTWHTHISQGDFQYLDSV